MLFEQYFSAANFSAVCSCVSIMENLWNLREFRAFVLRYRTQIEKKNKIHWKSFFIVFRVPVCLEIVF